MAGPYEKHRLKERLILLIEGYNETDNEFFLIEIREVTEQIMCYEEKPEEESEESDYYDTTETLVGTLQTDY